MLYTPLGLEIKMGLLLHCIVIDDISSQYIRFILNVYIITLYNSKENPIIIYIEIQDIAKIPL